MNWENVLKERGKNKPLTKSTLVQEVLFFSWRTIFSFDGLIVKIIYSQDLLAPAFMNDDNDKAKAERKYSLG